MGGTCKALSIERLVGCMRSVKLKFAIAGISHDEADLIIADFDYVRARHV
jgi:hypothetical protein